MSSKKSSPTHSLRDAIAAKLREIEPDDRVPVPLDWKRASNTPVTFEEVLIEFDERWDAALSHAGILGADENYRVDTFELTDYIREFHEWNEKIPTMYDMNKWIGVTPEEVMGRFDAWSAVLDAAFPGKSPECHQIPEEELLQEIERVASMIDDVPTRGDLKEYGAYSLGPYRNHFGSVSEAREAAGFYNPRRVTKEELIEDINRVAEEIGESPNTMDMNRHGEYNHQTFYGKEGWNDWWDDIIPAAGLEPNGNEYDPSPEKMKQELRDVAEKVGRPPTMEDIEEHSAYSYDQYYLKFDGLTKALEAAGVQ